MEIKSKYCNIQIQSDHNEMILIKSYRMLYF